MKKPFFRYPSADVYNHQHQNVTCVFARGVHSALHYLLHHHAFIIIIARVYNNNDKTSVVRENDEWKRKEKSGENREIHCSTAATRAYTFIYLPLIVLLYSTCNIYIYIYR